MSDDALVRELGKELPYERPDDARREAVRASLLAAATRREELPRQRWRVVVAFGAGALAAAAIALLVIGRRDPAAPSVERARIESSAAAELEHTVATTATGTDEIVRIHTGKVRVAMAAVKAGDRVAIETSDGVVDGAGAYEVAVRDDKLASVTVTAGTARVVVTGQKAVFLAAGQAWHAEVWTAEAELQPTKQALTAPPDVATPPPVASVPAITAPAIAPAAPAASRQLSAPAASAAPATHASDPAIVRSGSIARAPVEAPSPVPPPAMPPTVTTPKSDAPAVSTGVTAPVEAAAPAIKPVALGDTEQHFERGWKLLQAGKAIEAATELGLAAAGDGPIAIDARYFQAAALVKAGRKTEAEKALVGFLDHAPRSIRRGRAAVMLARLIAERGDKASARAWFEAAATDADPAVAAAAKAGIAALE